jgi:hypothetical protein
MYDAMVDACSGIPIGWPNITRLDTLTNGHIGRLFRLSAANYFPPDALIRSIALVIVTLAAS